MSTSKTQIIALGGGGFSDEPENPLLDLYVLEQANVKIPKICFLPTASGDADSYLLKFYESFSKYECKPSHLSLFQPHTSDIQDFILSQGVIYVGGGNTKSMLALWKEWGLDLILKKAFEKGIVLAGISAGAICWFEEGATDSIPGKISSLSCLGFVKGSCCPHYDGSELRRKTVPQLIQEKEMKAGYAIDDNAAIHIVDNKLENAISSIKGKKVVFLDGHTIRDIPVKYLG
ncbi:MAG: peptidase E [Alphaproteobacteria bacterium]|nr:peptidase E [Alphaproteobacteria bacterium]